MKALEDMWRQAGSRGSLITDDSKQFVFSDFYGVLFDPEFWPEFIDCLPISVTHAFIRDGDGFRPFDVVPARGTTESSGS